MKPILKFAAFVLLTSAVFFESCKKPVTPIINPLPPPPLPSPQSPPTGKTIKARVVEYNSGNPIAGAIIDLYPDYPNGNVQDLATDQNGVCSFITSGKFGYISVAKPGYWSLLPYYDFASPVIFYPDTVRYDPAVNVYACDSFVVKLFPSWNITVHVKDTSGSDRNTGFTSHGLFNLNGTTYNRYGSWMILRPGIDTTYQLPVFGNADNKFGIWKCSDDDCFIWSETLSQFQYIAVGNSITVNIFY